MADTTTQRLPRPLADNWTWQSAAACRGMNSEAFFHPSAEGRSEGKRTRNRRVDAAKAVCQSCPVIQECLDHALAVREPYGIWGGRSEDERAQMLGLQSLLSPMPAGAAKPRRRPTRHPIRSDS